MMHRLHLAAGQCEAHQKELHQRVQEGRTRAQGDEGIHVRCPVKERAETTDEEFPVDIHDDERQQHLYDGAVHRILKHRRERPACHIVAHAEIHQHGEQQDRLAQALLQLRRFMIPQGLFFGRHRIESTARSGAGCPFLFASLATASTRLPALHAGTIARVHYCFYDVLRCRVSLDGEGIGQQGDRRLPYPRHCPRGLLDARLAGRTAHPGHDILFHRCLFLYVSHGGYIPPPPISSRCQYTPTGYALSTENILLTAMPKAQEDSHRKPYVEVVKNQNPIP